MSLKDFSYEMKLCRAFCYTLAFKRFQFFSNDIKMSFNMFFSLEKKITLNLNFFLILEVSKLMCIIFESVNKIDNGF